MIVFFKGSRYADVGEAEIAIGDKTIRYKKIRIIPETTAHTSHTVAEGERLDHIAFAYYSDAQRFWRICDANYATWPDEVTSAPGMSLRIPPSEE